MEQSTIKRLQGEAQQAYDRLPEDHDAGPYLQAVMLAEIALQLAKQNALLESQNSLLDAIRSILNQSLA
jgi:hypothetical protein